MSIDIAHLLQTDGPVVLMVSEPYKVETATQLALHYRPNSDVLSQLTLPIHFFNYFRAQSRLQRDVILQFDTLKQSCCSWPLTYHMLETLLAREETFWPSIDCRIPPFRYTGRLTVVAGQPDKLSCIMKGQV